MPTVVRMDAMKDLRAKLDQYAEMTGSQFDGLGLDELGDLHRFLRLATAEIEEALVPAMVAGSAQGMTYVELASAAGYGSVTTIHKIMVRASAARGTGSNQPGQRRRRASSQPGR